MHNKPTGIITWSRDSQKTHDGIETGWVEYESDVSGRRDSQKTHDGIETVSPAAIGSSGDRVETARKPTTGLKLFFAKVCVT